MTDGLKTGLIVAGVAVAGYFIYSRMTSGSVVVPGAVPAATGQPLAPSPGAISPTSVSKSVGSYVGSYAANAGLAIATGGVSLLFTTGAGKAITSGVVSGVKSAGGAVYDAGSSVVHDVFSIF